MALLQSQYPLRFTIWRERVGRYLWSRIILKKKKVMDGENARTHGRTWRSPRQQKRRRMLRWTLPDTSGMHLWWDIVETGERQPLCLRWGRRSVRIPRALLIYCCFNLAFASFLQFYFQRRKNVSSSLNKRLKLDLTEKVKRFPRNRLGFFKRKKKKWLTVKGRAAFTGSIFLVRAVNCRLRKFGQMRDSK